MTGNSWPPIGETSKPATMSPPPANSRAASYIARDFNDARRYGGGGDGGPERQSFQFLRDRATSILQNERTRTWKSGQTPREVRDIKMEELMDEFNSVHEKGLDGLCASLSVILRRGAFRSFLP